MYRLSKFWTARTNFNGKLLFVYHCRIWEKSSAEWNTTNTKAPYHSASDGQAKRTVEIFKTSMNKMRNKKRKFNFWLKKTLSTYKATPCSITNCPSTEIIFGWRLWTSIDCIKLKLARTIQQDQDNMIRHAGNRKTRKLEMGDDIFVCNFGIASRWLSGIIASENGLLIWILKIEHKEKVIWHVGYIRKRILDKLTASELNSVISRAWKLEWNSIALFQVTCYQ